MIEISFPTGMLFLAGMWILFRAAAFGRNKQCNWQHEAIQLFYLVNLMVIARFVFYPFSTVNGQVQPLLFDSAAVWPFRINPIPFSNLLDYDSTQDMLINIIGNVAMFLPTGILTPLIYPRINTLRKVVLTGGMISLGIELLQLPFSVRTSDVNDLILNTTGCLVGYGIFALFRRIRSTS